MTRTILLADDSVTIQKVVELTFMDEDYKVVAVGTGDEAVAKLAEAKPDVVIADVHMPGSSGYEVARKTKERYPGTPVLLLVGTFEVFDAEEAARAGAEGHLKKPFDSQELLRRVGDLLAAPSVTMPAASAPSATVAVRTQAAPPPAANEEQLPDLEETFLVHPEQKMSALETVESAPRREPAFAPAPPVYAPPPPRAPVPAPAPAPPPPPPVAAVPVAAPSAVGAGAPAAPLSDADVDRIARRVVELVGEKAVRDVAWEVVPDLAEVVIKSRIRELEAQVE